MKKAELLNTLKTARRFNSLEFRVIGIDALHNLMQSNQGFVPVAQYGDGMFPLPDEVGFVGRLRLLSNVVYRYENPVFETPRKKRLTQIT